MATVADIAGQIPSLERVVVVPYLSQSPDLSPLDAGSATPMTWGQLAELGEGADPALRARPVRPPALGPLLVGHHRPPEGDRPGPRRDPARAAEEAEPPPRRPARRPRLLVHDDRLDDVELPGRGPAHPGLDRPLRRQPGPPRHGRPVGPRGPRRGHLLRHQRLLHRGLHEGRRRAPGGWPRPLAPAFGRLHRLPPLARGLRVGLRARRARHLALLDQRRDRRLHRLRRRRADPPGLSRRAAGPRARLRRRGLRRGRASPSSARSASWS